MRPYEVLSDQAVREIMSTDYMDIEGDIIFIVEPSSEPITPVGMMFMPFINVEFSKDSSLGMVYGTGFGCALIRKTALQDIQLLSNQIKQPIRTCRELVGALKRKGYKIKQNPLLSIDLRPKVPSISMREYGSSMLKVHGSKFLLSMLAMPFIGVTLGTVLGIYLGDWKQYGFLGLMIGLVVSLLGQIAFVCVDRHRDHIIKRMKKRELPWQFLKKILKIFKQKSNINLPPNPLNNLIHVAKGGLVVWERSPTENFTK